MDINAAEALRRSARPNIGKIIQNDKFPLKKLRFVGIRMRIFHFDTSQPNPIEFFNIEEESQQNITSSVLIGSIVVSEITIELDAMLEVIEWNNGDEEKYQYKPLEVFLGAINSRI